ncbi:hypothetical protein Tco_0666332 [Tanacetum coccineum]
MKFKENQKAVFKPTVLEALYSITPSSEGLEKGYDMNFQQLLSQLEESFAKVQPEEHIISFSGSIGTSSEHSVDLESKISNCDYYEKKMAREAEFKKQRVFNTGNGVSKPVWTNANRVNHANQFVPRSDTHLMRGPTFIRTVNAKGPQGRPKPVKAWWMLRHMTGNKDQQVDFEEFNGAVTLESTKAHIW